VALSWPAARAYRCG